MSIEDVISSIIQTLPSGVQFWANTASIILVGILIWQVIILKRQVSHSEKTTKIAYGPFISPRSMTIPQTGIYLGFSNIGSGSAKNIHFNIYDPETDVDLPPFDMFAMRPSMDEDRNSQADVLKHPVVVIEGTFENVIDELKTIHVIYHHRTRTTENLQENGLVF